MDGPAPGWYGDPGGSGGYRYWDGTTWTGEVRTAPHDGGAPTSGPAAAAGEAAPAAGQAAPAAGQAAPAAGQAASEVSGVPSPRRRSGTRWAVVAAIVVGVLVLGAVVSATMLQRGAATPIEAAEGLAAALDEGDLSGALRLIAPDEIEWAGELADYLPEAEAGSGGRDYNLDGLELDVRFGQPYQLAEGVEAIPITSLHAEFLEHTALTDALSLPVRDPSEPELRNDPDGIAVAVERGGSWFISPLGSLLEVESRELGFGGATAARGRVGASSPEMAVEDAVGLILGDTVVHPVDLLDPEELQILDHYRPVLDHDQYRQMFGLTGVPVEYLDLQREGDLVEVRQLTLAGDDSVGSVTSATLDLEAMCVQESGERSCLREELAAGALDPWMAEMSRALLEPGSLPVRIATVERDGGYFLSLEGTLRATLVPYLDRLGAHGRTVLWPMASPNVVEIEATHGELVTIPLHGNWNAARFVGEGRPLRACPPEGGSPGGWQVNGRDVVVQRRGDAVTDVGRQQAGIVVGVAGPEPVAELEVRLVDAQAAC